jgi:hypothetical protein
MGFFVGIITVVVVGSVLAWGWILVLRDRKPLDTKIVLALILLVLALLTGSLGAAEKLAELIR